MFIIKHVKKIFAIIKSPKVTFYGLGGKYRISLNSLPGRGGLRWGDVELSE